MTAEQGATTAHGSAPGRVPAECVFAWLDAVMDPEVPVVSVVDLGIVRAVAWRAAEDGNGSDECVVTVTPTYSGCPATGVIAADIRAALQARGIERVAVETRLSPAWSTDWLSAKGRDALRAYGIAPPADPAPGAASVSVVDVGALRATRSPVPCPLCGSGDTRLLSQFGSTACKALYRCMACREPFDYFKPH